MPSPSRSIFRQLDILLGLLDGHNTKATFFVMGALAEKFPEIVRRVISLGHEVASHGHDHLLVFRLLPEEFRRDTERSKGLLEDLAGKQVSGYRAPEFSIRKQALWALDILAELGFRYDSSTIPIHHRRYGIPGFSPDFHPYEFDTNRLDAFETMMPADVTQRLRGWSLNFHQNFRRRTVSHKVRTLLGSFLFTSFEEYLRNREIHECSSLF